MAAGGLVHLWFGKRSTLCVVRPNLSCDIQNLSCVSPNLSCVVPNLSFVLPNLSCVLPNLCCAQVENSNSKFGQTKHLFGRTTHKVAFCQTLVVHKWSTKTHNLAKRNTCLAGFKLKLRFTKQMLQVPGASCHSVGKYR